MSSPIFMFDGSDPAMGQAYADAQKSFKFFWRELSWERRRIVPAMSMSAVKLPFTDGPRTDGQPEYEHMWISDVDFDGETLSGKLLNDPNWLTSVRKDDSVHAPFSNLGDWLFAADEKAYGGFTVNVMRARMGRQERKQHDEAWGLDFGDPADIRLEMSRVKPARGGFLSGLFKGPSSKAAQPDIFIDHPMCTNMLPKYEEQLKADPAIAQNVDEAGWTLLHRDALAGNFGVVKLFVDYGADVNAKTPSGRTASELARTIGWSEIADFLDGR